MSDQLSHLSPVQRAIVELRELRARLAESERRLHQPIDIVGVGCRLPGQINDREAFWRALTSGVDAVTEVPSDRFDVHDYYDPDPDAAGKISSKWGGFLSDIDAFDA